MELKQWFEIVNVLAAHQLWCDQMIRNTKPKQIQTKIMLLMRKAAKRALFIIFLLCILYGCYTFFMASEPIEFQNNQYKM